MTKRVMAIASGGGHWQQLMLMRDGYSMGEVLFVTTLKGLPEQFDAQPSKIVPDCNRNEPLNVIRCGVSLGLMLIRYRPHVIISTGALPGVIALALGRLIGARTIWVDSVANAQEMSMSGRLAKRFAHLWLSQWEHVAEDAGAEYAGAVL